jgi:ribA/ribD-fused uncharacterized protein
MFDERGVNPGTPYEKEQWREIASHTENEIKGFFGDYRFLSNFWPAKVFLEGDAYATIENAYQAAKYKKEERIYFFTCTAKEAAKYTREHPMDNYTVAEWDEAKYAIMDDLLAQKFDPVLNVDNYEKLKLTGVRYLEESNYWEDKYWGVHKLRVEEVGEGENNLGKLLMKIRSTL